MQQSDEQRWWKSDPCARLKVRNTGYVYSGHRQIAIEDGAVLGVSSALASVAGVCENAER